ncbi:DNA methyltransferase [Sphingosinicella sp. CPCC 101087]|uniref:DNA methyltransferase n=1 Tax=Sphingosinicella sp. CPCC 101087 TaxID=2497754 RepID=UPI00101D6615|nr:DNA methyltransferase [Sphingosinicella sp. CPCC 101087]
MSSAGLHIQRRRKAMGISQAALASQVGVDKSYLSLVESGRRVPTEEQVGKLSAILGLPPELLLLQAGRLPKDVQGAIEADATAVAAAVRVWAEQDAIVYPTEPATIPRSGSRQKRASRASSSIPPLIHVTKASTTYRAHSYHTKVPPSAITPFIEAFTRPGELVSDPFCGSGMTGVAALDLGRNALLSDLSPAAVHIARNYTAPCDPDAFKRALSLVEQEVAATMDWLYVPIGSQGERIEYTVWSDVFICDSCSSHISYWDALHEGLGKELVCPECTLILEKGDLLWTGEEPVRTHVSRAGRRMTWHEPTGAELALIEEVDATTIPYWIPSAPFGRDREMWRSAHSAMGISDAAGFYTKRNLHALAALRHAIVQMAEGRVREALLFAFTACVNRASKRYQWNPKRPTNVMTGTMYVSSLRYEWNVLSLFRRKAADVLRFYQTRQGINTQAQVFQASATDLRCIPDDAVDLVFMDPPFGSNIFYADSSLLWDAWLGAQTDQTNEIVVNQRRPRAAGGKDLDLYGDLMAKAFGEAARIMRRGGRGVLAFSNTDDRVWTEVQDALSDAGLETQSVHVLNKGQPSIKGVKGQLGQERVTRLDLTLTLAHRTRPARKREAAPPAFVDASIQRALSEGATDSDHLYTAVLRDVLQSDLSATGITIHSIEARRAKLGRPEAAEKMADFVAGYFSDEPLPATTGGPAPDGPPEERMVPGSRNTALYNAHSYHTKVPPEAIRPFIEHFTRPGDVVLDPFCGSGMTGVAAAMAGRRAILSDLSTAAAHLAWNHTHACNGEQLEAAFQRVATAVKSDFDRYYSTRDENGDPATIRWTLWSTRHRCPQCRGDFLLWGTVDRKTGRMTRETECPTCSHRADRRRFEVVSNEPALIAFTRANGSRGERAATADDRLDADAFALESSDVPFPDVPLGADREMYQRCALHLQGIRSVRDMYTDRNRLALGVLWNAIQDEPDTRLRAALAFAFTNTAWHGTRMRRFNARGGHRPLTGTLYVPQLSAEANVLEVMRKKIGQLRAYYAAFSPSADEPPRVLSGSATDLSRIADASIDYVFTDPPFGSNIFYADCNLIWEAWLGRVTNPALEAVVNRSLQPADGGKTLTDYSALMAQSLTEMARVLKPGGWATIVFHNTDSAVWRSLSEAASAAGFEFHEAASLDRKQQSHKGYKGRDGHENVAHFDVVMNLRKPLEINRDRPVANATLDLARMVGDAAAIPEVAARGVQGVHAEVMRRLMSEGRSEFPDFQQVRNLLNEPVA